MTSVNDRIYTDSQEFGKFSTYVGAIIATVIGFIMLIFGLYFVLRKHVYTKQTMANIVSTECSAGIESNSIMYDCILNLSYEANGKPYVGKLKVHSKINYSNFHIVKIKYDNDDPTKIELGSVPADKTLGITMIIASILLIGISWLTVWATHRFKFVASAEGFATAYNLFD